ncbi:MAG: copper-binding protein [Candidatus Manganitrophus sp.]|nr:copper-binding protein [Candidatus Manganitrophus sp.]MDC4223555.1 copper-binding protein [Candidatus Manganitrophus sp.]WDT71845.1 MAG: copper-binding protein [Candidatus Manganitrophus sp.]WDT80766.1 MAG: copper-binding protein [Candidatus Manganitrophus sp.]
MKTIKRISILSMVLLGLTLLFSGISLASNEEGADDMGSAGSKNVVRAEKTTITAEVKGIDKANRLVTLQTPDGQTKTIQVPEEARNFDQIKVGDKVTMDYLQAVAVDIRKAGEMKPPSQKETVEVAPKGEKPSGKMVKTTQITANVEAIDPSKHTVTLKGPQGNSMTFEVDPEVKLDKIKVGDKVDVQYTEALAIKVTSPS